MDLLKIKKLNGTRKVSQGVDKTAPSSRSGQGQDSSRQDSFKMILERELAKAAGKGKAA